MFCFLFCFCFCFCFPDGDSVNCHPALGIAIRGVVVFHLAGDLLRHPAARRQHPVLDDAPGRVLLYGHDGTAIDRQTQARECHASGKDL